MSDDPNAMRALNRSWGLYACAAIIGFLAIGALFGFIILPVVQGIQSGVGAWNAICRAAGVSPGSPSRPQPPSPGPPQPVSEVAWTPAVLGALYGANRDEGKNIAATVCSACHGENGISPTPQWPNLAGQSKFAIYKQLHDFKSGARVNDLMSPIARQLSEEQMTNVAGYFANFARGTLDPQAAKAASEEARRLAEVGDTARALPACNSCHGERAGGPIETPTLTGQHREYLELQLRNFATGARRNDVFARMRNIASKLRPGEIKAMAEYYSSAKLPASPPGAS